LRVQVVKVLPKTWAAGKGGEKKDTNGSTKEILQAKRISAPNGLVTWNLVDQEETASRSRGRYLSFTEASVSLANLVRRGEVSRAALERQRSHDKSKMQKIVSNKHLRNRETDILSQTQTGERIEIPVFEKRGWWRGEEKADMIVLSSTPSCLDKRCCPETDPGEGGGVL